MAANIRSLFPMAPRPAERRLLQEGRLAGPMPWVIAIMTMLTVLAAAAGLSLGSMARAMSDDLADKLTIQIVESNPVHREVARQRLIAELRRLTLVEAVRDVPQEELAALIEPFLGADTAEADLPMPALIDVELRSATPSAIADIRALVRDASPSAQVIEQAVWLEPLAKLVATLRWIAAGLIVAMALAMSATVVLAVRSALNTHRATIDVMHLLGSTDAQLAALFQRRIALDALLGGIAGFAVALVALILLGSRIGALGMGLAGSAGLGRSDWVVLALVPVAGAAVAMICARLTVLRALRRSL